MGTSSECNNCGIIGFDSLIDIENTITKIALGNFIDETGKNLGAISSKYKIEIQGNNAVLVPK